MMHNLVMVVVTFGNGVMKIGGGGEEGSVDGGDKTVMVAMKMEVEMKMVEIVTVMVVVEMMKEGRKEEKEGVGDE